MRDVTLTIVFTFDPVTNLFNGRLENGAEFQFHGMHVQGKLGANLELFAEATRRIASPKLEALPPLPTANPHIEEDEIPIKILPPGAARGIGKEREARRAQRTQAKKDLANLKIEL